ncbi:MAG: FtsX-like permease family protein [Prevotellaceae bacterium]|nr:FtsX-like permease family protein [Prevotellaceae bacterium]
MINSISLVSAIGVAVGAFALVVALSIYNGIDSLVKSLYDTLSSDLRITVVEGKVFNPKKINIEAIKNIEGVTCYSESLEENALLKYSNKQHLAIVRGVDQNFVDYSGIADRLVEGTPDLKTGDLNRALVGKMIANTLNLRPHFFDLLWVYFPKRGKPQSLNPATAFNRDYLKPSAVFSVELEADSKYVFVSLKFMQNLLQYKDEVSSIDLYLTPGYNVEDVQQKVKKVLGKDFSVRNKAEQNEMLFRMMQSEKWAIFLILTFVLLVASFNSIGSLTMLIIEKKKDIKTFHALGAQDKLISRIFITEGLMISVLGCIVGVVLGVLACLAQIHFKIIRLSGNFVVDAYPVEIQVSDIFLVLLVVILIGYVAASIPVKYFLKKGIK